jgi:hypothetical protein
MRIISKFKDYYDSAHGWYSPEPVFVRDNQTFLVSGSTPRLPELAIETKKAISRVRQIYAAMPQNDFASRIVIAFCGKAYPCYLYEECGDNVFYSVERIEAFHKQVIRNRRSYFETLAAEKIIGSLNKDRNTWKWHRWGALLTYHSWKRFLLNNNMNIPTSAFLAVKSPIFLIKSVGHSEHIEINPRLNKLAFASQVDPYTAFQEISMYVGNKLVTQMDPNINRSDDMIRDSKGFSKWSFRKHKDDNKK